MNPRIVDQIAQQHVGEVRRAAVRQSRSERAGPAGAGSRRGDGGGAGGALRSRAGWALVHIGLRLAVRSADA
jgi:hypothetical protein